jgi:hypothetical protein
VTPARPRDIAVHLPSHAVGMMPSIEVSKFLVFAIQYVFKGDCAFQRVNGRGQTLSVMTQAVSNCTDYPFIPFSA